MAHTRKIKITNPLGLHARPAALFVKVASGFECDVHVERGDIRVNGKSIMGIMMLAAEKGARITVEADGADAEACLDALARLVKTGFSED
jgi:phosphocarrier protein HPr